MPDSSDPPEKRDKPTWLERLGLHGREAEPNAAPGAGAEIMAQARAFQTLTVGQVMIPRADIKAVELSTPMDALIAAFAESEHTRLPVYRASLDDPIGIAHLRDLFRLIAAGKTAPGAEVLPQIKRDTLFVPASMRAADLLVRMQSSRIHMAMVIDEFGGLDGLVTMEDLLEAVVGDIDDEHDEGPLVHIVGLPGGVLEVDGRAPLEDLERALGCVLITDDLDDEAIGTAAGLVTALAGRVPQRGEVIGHPDGFEFEITDADARRVKRLRARRRAGG
ncbi:MAG TPA: hemolysin family protein [Caulobacteraceae bacterium]|jgi:CBS domain containing-hemolysin-like protein